MLKKIMIFVFFISCVVGLNSCKKEENIKIGLSITLSGRFSEEGAEVRNAALMATEELNLAGGIYGKKIELLIRDDQNDYNTAMKVDEELINLGVRVIVGHNTSNMTSAVLPLMNRREMLLVSPTSVSDEFSHKDDYFIRIQPSHRKVIEELAGEIYHKRGISKLAVAKETINKNYTDNWLEIFKTKYSEHGGEIVVISNLVSGETKNMRQTATNIFKYPVQGLVIIANPIDAALFTVEAKTIKPDFSVFCSGWAMTRTFIASAKQYAEGVVFSYNANPECNKEKYLLFRNNFEEKFGYKPNFFARNTYDAFSVIFETMKNFKADTPLELKNAILKQRKFTGVVCNFEIDEFGDRIADPSIFIVKNNDFKRIN